MTKLDWAVTEHRLQLAREVAEELTATLAVTEPIDPFALAGGEKQMLRVICDNFRNRFDGQLEFHAVKRRFLMFVNTKYDAGCPPGDHHPRTRFSAAHELGHYFLDHHRACLLKGAKPHPSRSERWENDVMMEREADSFAGALLMPARLMRPLVNESELTVNAVNEFADCFGTSRVSTAIRSVQLSDFPVGIVGIRNAAVAWSFRADCLVPAGCYPPERGPVASPTAKKKWGAFLSGDHEQTTAQAYVREWFRTFDRDDLESLPVTEYFMPVPSMETLVVLLVIPEEELFARSSDDS